MPKPTPIATGVRHEPAKRSAINTANSPSATARAVAETASV